MLLSDVSRHNAPLGLQNVPRRRSNSSSSAPYPDEEVSEAMFRVPSKKRTANGKIILEPQPEESPNDPLNLSTWRRDAALLSLGFYCMVGGGMTPILAAGFTNIASTYDVTIPQVALTTGLYMSGLGVGSVLASPTAIKFGKRPVYIVTSCLFILTAVWCALSPTYISLIVARVVQGLVVSPVECMPSATIAEIFFLHERAYRLGIYTLLLLGGKNLVPLVSAAIIQSLGWRWVFWVVAIVVGFSSMLLFFLVPETFWDRTPRAHHERPALARLRRLSSSIHYSKERREAGTRRDPVDNAVLEHDNVPTGIRPVSVQSSRGVHFVHHENHFRSHDEAECAVTSDDNDEKTEYDAAENPARLPRMLDEDVSETNSTDSTTNKVRQDPEAAHSTSYQDPEQNTSRNRKPLRPYTEHYREAPEKSYRHSLRPYSGRLNDDNWFKIAARPFVLFAYPSILWSSAIYSLSVGWLIVLSESVTTIFRNKESYRFSAIGTGLVYISPFIGGILGTIVAGKVSDAMVRFMSAKNGGIYEPEFRLIMAIPVALATTIGLMGYGWSAQERDAWIVPTVFFGIISFGCSLGSTTAITFAVDSYRHFAGEALVTMNFSKNIFHGLVFSLFFNKWLAADGPKDVFLALGGIQLFFLLLTIPMYIYGKRARMWTVRKNFMKKL